jgi:hypothetical protein
MSSASKCPEIQREYEVENNGTWPKCNRIIPPQVNGTVMLPSPRKKPERPSIFQKTFLTSLVYALILCVDCYHGEILNHVLLNQFVIH